MKYLKAIVFIAIVIILLNYLSCGGRVHKLVPSPYDNISAQLFEEADSSYIRISIKSTQQTISNHRVPKKCKIVTWADTENLLLSEADVKNNQIAYNFFVFNIKLGHTTPIIGHIANQIKKTDYVPDDYLYWIVNNDTIVAFKDLLGINGHLDTATVEYEIEYTALKNLNDSLFLFSAIDQLGNNYRLLLNKKHPFLNNFMLTGNNQQKIKIQKYTRFSVQTQNMLMPDKNYTFLIKKQIRKLNPQFLPEQLIDTNHAGMFTLGMSFDEVEQIAVSHYSMIRDSNFLPRAEFEKYLLTENNQTMYELVFRKNNTLALQQIIVLNGNKIIKEGVKIGSPLRAVRNICNTITISNNHVTCSQYPNLKLVLSATPTDTVVSKIIVQH